MCSVLEVILLYLIILTARSCKCLKEAGVVYVQHKSLISYNLLCLKQWNICIYLLEVTKIYTLFHIFAYNILTGETSH